MSSPAPPPPRPAAAARCPACGSRLRPDEKWCSLCHRDVVIIDPQAAPVEEERTTDLAPASFVEHRPAIERPADPVAAAAADKLITELAAAEAVRNRESGISTLSGQLGGRSGGLIVASIGGVALLVVIILGLTLLGLVL